MRKKTIFAVLLGLVLAGSPLAPPIATAALRPALRPSATVNPRTGAAGTHVKVDTEDFTIDEPAPTAYWCPQVATLCGSASGPASGAVPICKGRWAKSGDATSCGGAIPSSAAGDGGHDIFVWQGGESHDYVNIDFTLTGGSQRHGHPAPTVAMMPDAARCAISASVFFGQPAPNKVEGHGSLFGEGCYSGEKLTVTLYANGAVVAQKSVSEPAGGGMINVTAPCVVGTAYQTKARAPFDEYHTHTTLKAQSPVETASSC